MIVKNILIGEDVRQETGNKISLMGILGDGLTININPEVPKDTPVEVQLAFLITVENDGEIAGQNDFVIQLSVKLGDESVAKFTTKVQTDVTTLFHLPIPRFGLMLVNNAILTVCAEVIQGDISISECTRKLSITLIKPTNVNLPEK